MPIVRRQSGFTLMEVLIALAILGIGMLAVISTTGTSTRSALELKQRTYAHWIALNRATLLRAAPQWPELGKQDGTAAMAGQTWHWTIDISQTSAPKLRRADINVALDNAPDEDIASLIVFIGKPGAIPASGQQSRTPQTGGRP